MILLLLDLAILMWTNYNEKLIKIKQTSYEQINLSLCLISTIILITDFFFGYNVLSHICGWGKPNIRRGKTMTWNK